MAKARKYTDPLDAAVACLSARFMDGPKQSAEALDALIAAVASDHEVCPFELFQSAMVSDPGLGRYYE